MVNSTDFQNSYVFSTHFSVPERSKKLLCLLYAYLSTSKAQNWSQDGAVEETGLPAHSLARRMLGTRQPKSLNPDQLSQASRSREAKLVLISRRPVETVI